MLSEIISAQNQHLHNKELIYPLKTKALSPFG
jgi:hypothetical protein